MSASPAIPGNMQTPSYANFSIMLVDPGGGGFVLMYNPKSELELIEADKTPQAFAAGYVPVRAIEVEKVINVLKMVTNSTATAIS